MLSKNGEIRRDEGCMDYAGQNVVVYPCHGMKGNQEWTYLLVSWVNLDWSNENSLIFLPLSVIIFCDVFFIKRCFVHQSFRKFLFILYIKLFYIFPSIDSQAYNSSDFSIETYTTISSKLLNFQPRSR